MSALPTPMSESEAKQVTTSISTKLRAIADNAEAVVELIEQAKAGDAHKALRYDSWTAYVTDRFGGTLARLEKAERVPIVAHLAETGMSVRSIAAITDTSKSTIDREVSHGGTPATGTDGKSYPRTATFLKSGKPDASSTEDFGNAAPEVKRKPRRRPITDAYRDATYDLHRAVERLQRIHVDDRFPANRNKLAAGGARPFSEVVYMLQRLEYDLDGNETCSNCEARIVPTWDNWRDRRCETCGGGGRDG